MRAQGSRIRFEMKFRPFGLVEPCVLSWPGEFPVETHYMELTPLRAPRRCPVPSGAIV